MIFGLGRRVKKTPTVLQMEAVECGAASLSMILSYYGRIVPLEELRQECGVNRDGSKASNMLRAARRYGMEAKGNRRSADDMRKPGPPQIIHWNFNHFIVFEGIKGGYAYLNDPAMGHRRVPFEEFSKAFTGVTLTITPGEDFKRGGKKYSVTRDVARKLASEKAALLFIIIVGLLMILPGLASPAFDQIFVDDILSGSNPHWLSNLIFAMGVSFLLTGSLTMLRAWCLTKWQTKLTLRDSSLFFWHIIRLPISFFQQRFAGEIAMRVSFNETVANTLTSEAATAVLDILVALFYLALLIQYSPSLTAIGAAFSALNIILMRALRKYLVEMSMRLQQDAGKMMGTAVGGIQVIETLKSNGNEADFFARWAGYSAKFNNGTQDIMLASQLMTVAPALFGGINTALIMAIGGFQIMDGVMSAGSFIAFRSLMGSFQQPVTKLVGLSQSLQNTEMQMHRLNDVRRYDIDKINYPDSVPKHKGYNRLSGLVELKDVTFGYSPLDDPLIENFNLTLKPGKWVALIGGSGSGKSTVARIVSGLYQSWSGKILFDSIERKDISKDVIINSVSCVDQEIYLFPGTVRENLSLFDPSIPESDITRAAVDALIHDDILKLENSYNHRISEGGANFSGGQRQRLEIARALAMNPSILIFDEATSALDPITEEALLTNIRRRGCACLTVAHRLSAFRDCDEIIVLEYGRVVQRGTHDEMMAEDGPYRRLLSERAKTPSPEGE
ncbi:MAG: NHLP family bacteriocin export ABC transporter peptidase/permease/ATPase subunit [Synergistaceae bacterium]|jgi:NHLM bacteriocin system ABC transporter peptidase/ATP-binding protein|nr:NHLP family bacteriocin export ABC transporter peptidase/permease/ATPase subunit [Synergistaceae bacterium]